MIYMEDIPADCHISWNIGSEEWYELLWIQTPPSRGLWIFRVDRAVPYLTVIQPNGIRLFEGRGDQVTTREQEMKNLQEIQDKATALLEQWHCTDYMSIVEKAVAENLVDRTPRMILADAIQDGDTEDKEMVADALRGTQGQFIALAWAKSGCKPALRHWAAAYVRWREIWKSLVLPTPTVVEEIAQEFRKVGISTEAFITLMHKGILDGQQLIRKFFRDQPANPTVSVPVEGDPQAPTLPGPGSPG